jgi:hypothetical protein
MPLKYGDSVVLIQKSPDGYRRVNAIVLASHFQPKNVTRAAALKNDKGILPEGEYLDLEFPRALPEGQRPKSRDDVFQPAYTVPPFVAGAAIGWRAIPVPDAKLKAFLMANFKDETGDETPEDCAIRLLTKVKAPKK